MSPTILLLDVFLSDAVQILYEREGTLFDHLWEVVFRLLLPHARETAR